MSEWDDRVANRLLEIEWKNDYEESDFFDVRYKGKKFTQDEVSQDGEFTEEFKEWVKEVMFGKDFDWEAFGKENDMEGLYKRMQDTNSRVFHIKEDIYLTKDGVIGIGYQYLVAEYTVKEKRKKNGRMTREFFNEQVHVNDDGFFLKLHGGNISLRNHVIENGNLVEK